MKRKKTPPSQFVTDRLDRVGPGTRPEVQSQIRQILVEVRYLGDIKQLAERYGLHFLKSKRMRSREHRQWILDNHPAVKAASEDKEPEMVVGVDWATEPDRTVASVGVLRPDGSIKFLDVEEYDEGRDDEGGPAGADRSSS